MLIGPINECVCWCSIGDREIMSEPEYHAEIFLQDFEPLVQGESV